jgi:tetratricopeptide (TPR) repeat protein
MDIILEEKVPEILASVPAAIVNKASLDNGIKYILEELAVLEGCVAQGLFFSLLDLKIIRTEIKLPLFIVYPGEEERAFIEARKQYKKMGYKQHVANQWMAIRLSQVNYSVEDSSVHDAYFVKQEQLRVLLQNENKNLLFLISVGQKYHEGPALQATVDLFSNVIQNCITLWKEVEENRDATETEKAGKNRILGTWNVLVVVADTLQAYNDIGIGSEKENKEKWRKHGENWQKVAMPLFKQLQLTGKGQEEEKIRVNINLNFIRWEELLEKAKIQFNFEEYYQHIVKLYQSPGGKDFYSAVNLKKDNYLARQKNKTKKNKVEPKNIEECIKANKEFQSKNEEKTVFEYSNNSREPGLLLHNTIKRYIYGIESCYASSAFNISKDIASGKVATKNFPSLGQISIPREKILFDITNYFSSQPQENKGLILTLYGMGGMGKTHIAAYYGSHTMIPYKLKVWIDANKIVTAYKKLGYGLGLPEVMSEEGKPTSAQKIREAVIYWLERNPKWLLIFDNVEDEKTYKEVEKYCPTKGGHILITSRKENPFPFRTSYEIGQMNQSESVAFFKELGGYKEEKDETIVILADRLGHMPLALEQTASYLRKNNGIGIDQLLTDFKQVHDAIMKEHAQESLSQNPVATTFQINFKQIVNGLMKELNLTKDQRLKVEEKVKSFLTACAYLYYKDIPLTLLQRWFKEQYLIEEIDYFDLIINKLDEYKLVKINQGRNTIDIHCVIQDVVLAFYKPAKEMALEDKLVTTFPSILKIMTLVTLLEFKTDQVDDKRKNFLLSHLKNLVKHYESFYSEKKVVGFELGDLYDSIGDTLLDQGQPKQALTYLECGLKFKETFYGSEHWHTAITLRSLGSVYNDLGDNQNAKALLECALKIQEVHDVACPWNTAFTLEILAIVYEELGDIQKAKELLEQALAIQESHFGVDHLKTAVSLLNLANVYRELGDSRKKKELLVRVLKIKETHYGTGHWQTACALENLGNAYSDLGDNQKQKELLEQALVINETHYGTGHWKTGGTLNNLGNAYSYLSECQKAKELFEQALKIEEAHYGVGHWKTAVSLASLGDAYRDLGNSQKAKELLEQALAIQESHYGANHRKTTEFLENLAIVYIDVGNNQKAKELLERALIVKETHYGADHWQTVTPLESLGCVYRDLGNSQMAKKLHEKVLKIQEAHYGTGHWRAAFTLGNLGVVYRDLGDSQKAKELFEQALKFLEAQYGVGHWRTASTLGNLASVYIDLSECQKAKELFERALTIKEAYYGADHWQTASILEHLSEGYKRLGDSQKAKESLERALKIKEANYGVGHWKTATPLTNLAVAYKDSGDTQKAKESFERALKIDEAHYGDDHWQVVLNLKNLAAVYKELNDGQKAKALLDRVLEIQKTYCNAACLQALCALLEILSSVHEDLGNSQELLAWVPVFKEIQCGANHWQTTINLEKHSVILRALGANQKTIEFLQQIIKIQEHIREDVRQVNPAITGVDINQEEKSSGNSQKEQVENAQPIASADRLEHQLLAYGICSEQKQEALFGILPNGTSVNFLERKVAPDGNCGFTVLRATRNQVADCLIKFVNDQEARGSLVEEIREAFETKILSTDKWQQLTNDRTKQQTEYDELRKRLKTMFPGWQPTEKDSLESQETELIRRLEENKQEEKKNQFILQRLNSFQANEAVSLYYQTQETFEVYIEALRNSLWLGYKSALLYAKNNAISLYIWKKKDGTNQVDLINYHTNNNDIYTVIHMLPTDGFTHFNRLVRSELPNKLTQLNVRSQKMTPLRKPRSEEIQYGAEHSQAMINLTHMVAFYLELNNIQELFEQSLKIQEAHYGTGHRQTVIKQFSAVEGGLEANQKTKEFLEYAINIIESFRESISQFNYTTPAFWKHELELRYSLTNLSEEKTTSKRNDNSITSSLEISKVENKSDKRRTLLKVISKIPGTLFLANNRQKQKNLDEQSLGGITLYPAAMKKKNV